MSVRQLALRSFSFRMRFGLNFVGCVKELLSWKRVVEDFAIFEETLQFHSGIFKRIAGVNDIFLERHAEIATDSARGRFATTGGTCHLADHFHSTNPLIAAYHHRGNHHRVFQLLEERFVGKMGIMLAHLLVGELAHFHAGKAEAFLFESFCYSPTKPLCRHDGFKITKVFSILVKYYFIDNCITFCLQS